MRAIGVRSAMSHDRRNTEPGQQDDIRCVHEDALQEVDAITGQKIYMRVGVMHCVNGPDPAHMHQAMVPVVGKVLHQDTDEQEDGHGTDAQVEVGRVGMERRP